MPENPKNPNDAIYKAFFSVPEMVESLLRDFVPLAFVEHLDFASLQLCNGESTSPGLARHQNDLVWRLRCNNEWLYIYLMLEFQSLPEKYMALRILGYSVGLWQELQKQKALLADGSLPPVFPMVLYNGRRPWRQPQGIEGLFCGLPDGLRRYQPMQSFYIVDEAHLPPGLVENKSGPAAALFRLEQANEGHAFIRAATNLWKILQQKVFQPLRVPYQKWLNYITTKRFGSCLDLDLEEAEMTTLLEQKFEAWERVFFHRGRKEGRKEGRAEGRIEGIAEGRIEGIAEGLKQMLSDRFPKEDFAAEIDAIDTYEHLLKLMVSSQNVKSAAEMHELFAAAIKGE